jgi:hypothetical protein
MMKFALLTIVSLVLGSWSPALCAEQDDAALIKAVSSAEVTLQKGLTASQREGRPIWQSSRWKTVSSNSPSTPKRMGNFLR